MWKLKLKKKANEYNETDPPREERRKGQNKISGPQKISPCPKPQWHMNVT